MKKIHYYSKLFTSLLSRDHRRLLALIVVDARGPPRRSRGYRADRTMRDGLEPAKLWRVRSRLYRSRFFQVNSTNYSNTHFAAFFFRSSRFEHFCTAPNSTSFEKLTISSLTYFLFYFILLRAHAFEGTLRKDRDCSAEKETSQKRARERGGERTGV